MSDDLRQDTEDLCVDSETCEREADTETGEKPCIGCEEFAAASGEVTVEAVEDAIEELGALAETAMQTIDPLLQAEVNRQTEIREKIAERLQLLDAAKGEEATLKEDHKDAKACVETHKKALENLCRSLVTPPERSLLDGAGELTPTHPVGEDDTPAEATTEVDLDESEESLICNECGCFGPVAPFLKAGDTVGSLGACPRCSSTDLRSSEGPDHPEHTKDTVQAAEEGEDTPEGDGEVDDQ